MVYHGVLFITLSRKNGTVIVCKEVAKMEKMNYVEPTMEVIVFETEDVIVTSGIMEFSDGIELPDHAW